MKRTKLTKNYLKVKDNVLHYEDINCLDLVNKFGSPVKIGYPYIIIEKIKHLKECFNNSITKYNYTGNYYYANANKASYYAENVITAVSIADQVETSSFVDLIIVERIFKKKIIKPKTIILNGIKDESYLNKFLEMSKKYKFLFVVDNLEEYKFLCHNYNNATKLDIMLRVNLFNIYSNKHDRFGLSSKEIQYLLKNLDTNKFNVKGVHFHQRSSLYSHEKNLINLEKTIIKLKNVQKIFPNATTLNIGGGVPYDKIKEYHYQKYTDNLIKDIIKLCKKHNIKHPDIIQENGRYTVSDSCFNIYEVTSTKDCEDGNPWYIINDSIMTTLANTWALNEEFLFLPINFWDRKFIPVKLAGNTCDGDDVYYFQNKTTLKMPKIQNGEKLYIGVFGMGAYQEILSGIGGIHHCLNREENDLIIYKKNGKNKFYNIRKVQSVNAIISRLDYKKISHMKRYINQK